ncbi:hypothetical protein Bbelb_027750 [Branchiostoma belcheri]|nr:hypothetical protein Bbelb_027750 [Branchiostoma belcheri]
MCGKQFEPVTGRPNRRDGLIFQAAKVLTVDRGSSHEALGEAGDKVRDLRYQFTNTNADQQTSHIALAFAMLRVCEKLREADKKGRRYGLARAETGYLRALVDAMADTDRLAEVELLKTLGDVNVEKGRLGKDVGKFNTALSLYLAAKVRCYHEEQADGIEHRYHYTERLLQGVSSQGKAMPTEDKETTTPAKVAAKFQALDKRRATGGNTDSLLVGYAQVMVETIVNDDSMLETEAIKSLGDVYLKRATETGDTRDLTRAIATALYNRALARCQNVHGTVVIVHRLLHTAKIRQDLNTRNKRSTDVRGRKSHFSVAPSSDGATSQVEDDMLTLMDSLKKSVTLRKLPEIDGKAGSGSEPKGPSAEARVERQRREQCDRPGLKPSCPDQTPPSKPLANNRHQRVRTCPCVRVPHKRRPAKARIQFVGSCGTARITTSLSSDQHFSKLDRRRSDHLTEMASSAMVFYCNKCGKDFSEKRSLTRHQNSAHTASPTCYICKKCNRTFSRLDALKRHEKQHAAGASHQESDVRGKTFAMVSDNSNERSEPTTYRCETCEETFTRRDAMNRHHQQKHTSAAPQHECDFCGKQFARKDKLREHKRTHDKQPTRLTFRCRLCNTTFNTVGELQRHREEAHTEDAPPTSRGDKRKLLANADESAPKRSRKVQPLSPNDPFPLQEDPLDKPEDLALEDEDPALEQMYRRKWSNIRTHFERKSVHDKYNFRMNSVNVDDLADKVWAIFRDQKTSFKINLSYGFVLRNNEGELRYYYPCENNHTFLEKPVIVDSEEDLQRFLDQITNKDILEYCRQQRPDSKWIVHAIPHVEFYVSKLSNHPIGAPKNLPAYLVHNKAIVTLQSGTNGPFDDNLCFFRCLAAHYGKDPKQLETATKELLKQYLEAADLTERDFCGVSLEDVADIEKLFQVNVYVYSFQPSDEEDEGNDTPFAELVRRPLTRYKNTMYLNLYEDHFSYIQDFKKYAKSYGCPTCGRKFKRAYNLRYHQTKCTGAVKYVYPGGAYNRRQTIFEQLDDVGIHVDPKDRFYPYRTG